MAHIPRTTLHAYEKRAVSVLVDVVTSLTPGDLTNVVFQVGALQKTGLTPEAGGSGIEVPVELTVADLTLPPGVYGWECRATVGAVTVVVATGIFQLAAEPTVA